MATRPADALPPDLAPWEQFYEFGARPFSLTPDLRFAFHSRSHSEALQQLTDALRRREGIIVITGDIGTGKTMLCRTLLETFERRTFVSVVLDPSLGVDDLLRQALQDFGLVPHAERGAPLRPAPTRHQMVTMLQRFLATLVPLNAHAVVIVDEAQQVDPSVLEQLRLLTNFETDAAKLLQVVLVGQPNLDELLARPDMKQVAQRVARRIELYPLSELEVQRYIERRLVVATEAGKPLIPIEAEAASPGVQFSPAAFRAIATLTGGIPRVINTLCDRALEIAFERRTRTVDEAVVDAAAQRLKLVALAARLSVDADPIPRADADDLFGPARPSRHWLVYAGAAIVAFAVVLGGLSWAGRGKAPQAERRGTPPAAAQIPAAQVSAAQAPAAPATRGADSAPQPSAPPASAEATAPAASRTSPPSAGQIYVAVAAFRTPDRAATVAAQLTAAGLRAEARSSPAGTWQQVVVGPFLTADEAAAAQQALTRQGFAGSRILKP